MASFERLSLMAQVFRGLEFEPLPSVQGHKVWRWRQSRQQTLVEFITASSS